MRSIEEILIQLSNELDDELSLAGAISGGCINEVLKLKGASSQEYVLKVNFDTSLDERFFTGEKEGLEILSSICQRLSLNILIPEILAIGKNFICLPYIEFYGLGRNQKMEVQFAEDLYRLHTIPLSEIGKINNNFLGMTPQINPEYFNTKWSDYFWNNRIEFLLKKLSHPGLNEQFSEARKSILQFIDSFNLQVGVIHGDLWSENVFYNQEGKAVLIDPAVSIGDGRSDIAMSRLFGSRSPEFYQTYNSLSPWNSFSERSILTLEEIYNMYHLLNHALLFGGSYSNQAEESLHRILREI
jgi:protein-ribulosamine 3-kinase